MNEKTELSFDEDLKITLMFPLGRYLRVSNLKLRFTLSETDPRKGKTMVNCCLGTVIKGGLAPLTLSKNFLINFSVNAYG